MNILVRRLEASLLIAAVLGVMACTPAAPGPTATPSKPVATSAAAPAKPTPAAENKPAAPATASAKPAASPAAKTAPSADWKAEWDRTVAAAKKEGKVVVAGGEGESFRQAASEFRKAYPEISLEYNNGSAGDHVPRIIGERQADRYLWDVIIGGSTPLFDLSHAKMLVPLRSALILPEVLDDSKWFGGFDAGFMDRERQYIFSFFAYRSVGAWVNRDVAPASELSKVEQLVEPKWKGKMAWLDPRRPGSSQMYAAYLVGVGQEELLKKMLAQELVLYTDNRTLLESLVRGRHVAGFGVGTGVIKQFSDEGVLGKVEPLDRTGVAGGMTNGGTGHVAMFDKAPNPNAAKVFVNWVLSKEGQEAHVKYVNNNSRRLDVEGPAETALPPGATYKCATDEGAEPDRARAIQLAKDIIK